MKKKYLLVAGIVVSFLVFESTNVFAENSDIIAQGDFSVYKQGKLVHKMSGTTPVTEESLLVCTGNCLVKTSGIALIAQDGTEMAVKKGQGQFNLMVVNGLVDFSLTEQIGKVGFYTGDGQYTVGAALFNTSTENAVRGYMQVLEDGRARVGLHQGRMVFNTAQGPETVNSNEYILLAQAEVSAAAGGAASAGGTGAAATAGAAGIFSTGAVLTTGVVVAVVATTVVVLDNNNDDDPPASSSGSSSSSQSSSSASSSSSSNASSSSKPSVSSPALPPLPARDASSWKKGSKWKKESKITGPPPWANPRWRRPLPPPPWQRLPCPDCPPPWYPPPPSPSM